MIGIDIITISRMEKLIEKFGEKALQRFLSTDEISYIKNPTTAAGFWAAKEAASKAIGTGIGADCGFSDIMLSKSAKGAPLITFSQKIIDRFQITDSSVSITHDGGMAIAVVAIEGKS